MQLGRLDWATALALCGLALTARVSHTRAEALLRGLLGAKVRGRGI